MHASSRLVRGTALVAAGLVAPVVVAQQVSVDPALRGYTQVEGVSGSIKSVGSDTMNNEMTLWAEGFLAMYPNVRVEIEGKASAAPPTSVP
jgi:phosphate transport system substrate-binding protein